MYFIPFHGLLNCKCVSAKIAELNVGSKQSLEHLWILNIPIGCHWMQDGIGLLLPQYAVRQRAHAAVRQDRSRGVRVNVVAAEAS